MLPPLLDLSSHTEMQTIISDGRTTYQGHPTTVLMPDGKTLFCVWTIGHGGPCAPLKKSTDGGRSWSGLLPTPANWRDHVNCPTIWHLPTAEAPLRLVVYAQEPESRRMVIVYATEVVNSGMVLGAGRARLVKPGSGPGLLRTGEFTLSIQNRNGGTWKLYALTLAGEREEELPVEYRNSALILSVNTAKLKGANTPFFELVRAE